MKRISQMDVIKSVRKPLPPPTRIERPVKGRGYRRKMKFMQDEHDPYDNSIGGPNDYSYQT